MSTRYPRHVPQVLPPAQSVGQWLYVGPSGEYPWGQGMAAGSPGTFYWCKIPTSSPSTLGGIFKTTDYFTTWRKVGSITPIVEGADNYISTPLHVVVDPNNSNIVYAVDGVNGNAQGFYKSTNGMETAVMPAGFLSARAAIGVTHTDCYFVAIYPNDSNHLLITDHSDWGGAYGANSGMFETFDGGVTFSPIAPEPTWGHSHTIHFLCDPSKGIGNSNRQLLTTQGDGRWLTTDGWATRTKVSTFDMAHGGNQMYYAPNGTLYSGGYQGACKSTDNGATWSVLDGPTTAANCVVGDGINVYYAQEFANGPLRYAPIGGAFSDYDANNHDGGLFEAYYDAANGRLICAFDLAGMYLLRLR